jgi:hypothetical protein
MAAIKWSRGRSGTCTLGHLVRSGKRQRADRLAFESARRFPPAFLKVLSGRYAGTCTKSDFSFFLLPRVKYTAP